MEESTEAVGVAAETSPAASELASKRIEALGAQIGRHGAFAPSPHAFDRVQFRCVGGKTVHGEPRALGLEVGAGFEAAVRMEPVPEQDHGTWHVTTQMSEETHDLGGADGAGMRHPERASVSRRPRRIGQRADHGEVVPAPETVGQDRRVPARRPGAADRGAFGEAALVDEDDRRPAACGVFFRAGQVVFTQRWMAGSSRSLARVVGF